MNKLGLLLRVQLTGLLGINKVLHSGDSKEKTKLVRFTVLFGFVAVLMLASLVFYDYLFGSAFYKIGIPELLPALMMAVASVVTLFTTIYKVNGLLFGFKDYDMTMAMPIKTSTVVASRLLLLYFLNVGLSLIINITAAVVYAFFVSPPLSFYPVMLVLSLFVPMAPILIGTGIGLLVTAAASRFKHANAVNIIITIGFFLAIMAGSFAIPTIVTNAEEISKSIMNSVYRIYPLTEMYTNALCKGDVVSLLVFVLISLLLFGAFAYGIGRFFKFLNTAITTSRTRSNYRLTALRASSALDALYRRELRRYFSSTLYVLNTGFGMIMALLMGVALLFFKPEQLEAVLNRPGFADAIGTMSPMVLVILVGMSCTTCCSISLEGKNFWIVKSMPVRPETIFQAKILVNLTITVPATVITALLMAFALHVSPIQLLFLLLTPVVFALLVAETGLLLNLMHPNFTWTTETQIIKQSLPVMISILGGMAVSIGLLIGLMALPQDLQLFGLVIVTTVAAALDFALYRLLQTKGAKMLQAM